MVQVNADSEDISKKSDDFFKGFDLVVATDCSADQLVSDFYILHSDKHRGSQLPELIPVSIEKKMKQLGVLKKN